MAEFEAYLESFHEISLLIPRTEPIEPPFYVKGERETLPLEIVEEKTYEAFFKYRARFEGFILLNKTYFIHDNTGHKCELYTGEIVRSSLFDELYYYDGDLGHFYTPWETVFKVWTPVAKSVNLILMRKEKTDRIPLEYDNRGLWKVTIEDDLEGAAYYYEAYVNGKGRSFLDPYAIASGPNGCSNYVIDPAKLNTPAPFEGRRGTDAIIYETSVRDLTMDPAISARHRGKFRGVVERGLRTKKNKTAGFDYLRELGITHVQFMPFNDFEGVDELDPEASYNWGYNPSQYNVPEGSYATHPEDPYSRIRELQYMIDTLHRSGLGVVMDVVYNHVYDVNTFPFGKMVPGYAYRVDENGKLTNASGCGSDLATERRMVRKFIVDSLMHWARVYGIDGFRFDLMGLIDVETMHLARQKLEAYDPSIIVYGEGWNIPTVVESRRLTHLQNNDVLFNIGFFNDMTRDIIKGSTFQAEDSGYSMGSNRRPETVKAILRGSTVQKGAIKYPAQSVNYVECHDDHTFYDKARKAMPDAPREDRKRAQKLATSMVLLMQGVPFIHSGQEFYRSKRGVRNSYKSPDSINRIEWSKRDTHADDVDDFKRLVGIRKDFPLFRLNTAYEVKHSTRVRMRQSGTCLYEIFDETEHLTVIFKNNKKEETFEFETPQEVLYHSEPAEHETTSSLSLDEISTTVLRTLGG